MTSKVYDKQIGGSHYKDMAMQPSEFINKNKLQFAEGNAIKYICRHAHKGEVEDLEKAKHYIDMIIERDYPLVPMTEEEEYRNAGISKEEAEKKPETWIEGYKKWKELSKKGVVSNKVKLKDIPKVIKNLPEDNMVIMETVNQYEQQLKDTDAKMITKLEEINELKNKIANLEESLHSKEYWEKPDYKFLVEENLDLRRKITELEQEVLETKLDNKKLAQQISTMMERMRDADF